MNNHAMELLGIKKIIVCKKYMYECQLGRFDLTPDSLPYILRYGISEISVRKFAKLVCSSQDSRVMVELQEAKGKITKVTFRVHAGEKKAKKTSVRPNLIDLSSVGGG